MKQAILSRLIGETGLRSLSGRVFRWSGVLALNYHRVGDGSQSMFDRGLWSATAEAFADQIRFCKAHFDIISPADLPDVLARGRGRYILVTFDDGYRDNYEVAFPILKGEGVPATFFVATGFIDSPKIAWWDEIAWMVRASTRCAVELPHCLPTPIPLNDRERAVSQLLRIYKAIPTDATDAYLNDIAEATGSGRYDGAAGGYSWMTWDMLREMRAQGMCIGGHTVTHPILAQAHGQRQLDEIRTCGQRLATELGDTMRYFSYPVGATHTFDTETRACLTEVGVPYAFSYYGGYRRFDDWDDHDIRRVPIETYLTSDWFRSIVMLPQIFG
jgi:peptidoglycan/xylan/chitin deacetylase (PgdA/CDA1 family)